MAQKDMKRKHSPSSFRVAAISVILTLIVAGSAAYFLGYLGPGGRGADEHQMLGATQAPSGSGAAKMQEDVKKENRKVLYWQSSMNPLEIYDQPGKDSYELRKAGASQVLVASAQLMAYIRESDRVTDPRLDDLLNTLDLQQVDLVLVEGFRHVPFPKIELHRPALRHDLIFPEDSSVIAVATDETIDTDGLPRLDINRPDEVMRSGEWLSGSQQRLSLAFS